MNKTLTLLFLFLALASAARAGDIVATQHGKTLKVTAGSASDALFINSLFNGGMGIVRGTARLEPVAGTTVNGSASPVQFSGVENLSVSLGDGDNGLNLVDFMVSGNVSLKGGHGGDDLQLLAVFIDGNLSIDAKDGHAILTCSGAVEGSIGIKTSDPVGSVVTLACATEHGVKVSLGAGADNVYILSSTSVRGATTLSTGAGNDSVECDGSATFFGSLKLSLGSGSNSFSTVGCRAFGSLAISGGPGADVITANPLIANGAKLSLGGGENVVSIGGEPSQVSRSLVVSASGQDDVLSVQDTQVGENLVVKAGGGNNQITLESLVVEGNLSVSAGGGDDTLALTGNAVDGKTKLSLGGGNNTLPL